MNIFFVDRDPSAAARALCDKHLRKMLLETAQILCTVHHIHRTDPELIPYKPTHAGHPCVKWAAESKLHFYWLWNYGGSMGIEYLLRFGKSHKSSSIISEIGLLPFPMGWGQQWSDPPQCMPHEYKCDNTVEAYRRYYALGKRDVCSGYTRTKLPVWLEELRADG